MKTTTTITAFFGALLLAGCAATTPFDDSSMPHKKVYNEPSSGPKARIRISTDGIVRLAVGTVCSRWDDPASGVGPNTFDTPLLTVANNNRRLGMPMKAEPGLTTTELYIPAGRPLLLHYMNYKRSEAMVGNKIRTTTQTCDGVFAFTPEAGMDYTAKFIQTAAGNQCLRGVATMAQPDLVLPNIAEPGLCAM